ncbi:MAG: hypothetical protein Q3976_06065 [Corynebacterium sp.]|nr:hypothetical protein [Corynebacterium sp.]
MSKQREKQCQWCRKPLTGTHGRKKYCSQSCRQRAYEQRRGVSGKPIPINAVVLSEQKVEILHDKLFELRCSAEDVATAVEEGSSAIEIRELCTELVDLAKSIEQMR